MRLFLSFFMAASCIGTALVSNSMMGAGMWFWVILVGGLFVLFSSFKESMYDYGAVVAGLLSALSVCAVALGLVAATAGGFFNMDDGSSLLLTLFFINAVFGIILVIAHKKSKTTK